MNFLFIFQGIFRPLSNYFALPFDMKGEKYRSVEHYAYQRLFDALRLDDKCIGELRAVFFWHITLFNDQLYIRCSLNFDRVETLLLII